MNIGETLTVNLTWAKLIGAAVAGMLAFWGAGELTFSSLKDDVREIRDDMDTLAGADTTIRENVAAVTTQVELLKQIAQSLTDHSSSTLAEFEALKQLTLEMQKDVSGRFGVMDEAIARIETRLDTVTRPVSLTANGTPIGATISGDTLSKFDFEKIPGAEYILIPANRTAAEGWRDINADEQ